jgi:5-formyltetrahydrofolate cyclo-ligase
MVLSIDQQKKRLRQEILKCRDAVTAEERKTRSAQLCQQLEKRAEFFTPKVIAAFMPVRSEVDILPLLKKMKQKGHTIALPKTVQDTFYFREMRDWEELKEGPFSILEPPASAPQIELEELDIVFVPGLAFDPLGHRLGYGKGYYDRALAHLGRHITTLGVCFEEQVVEYVPHDETDIPVQEILFT